ncbi:MAG: GrpB family protein [Bacteroidota bacterium]
MLILSYTSNWADDFQRIQSVLKDKMADPTLQIEHIGSTAVPGLAAKPIIDLDLIFQTEEQFNLTKSALQALGYYHNGDQGIAGREVFKRNKHGAPHPILDRIAHHLYVCQADNLELKRHLSFRDALIQRPELRQAYQQLKLGIAEAAEQDRKTYARLKEEQARAFIENILNTNT